VVSELKNFSKYGGFALKTSRFLRRDCSTKLGLDLVSKIVKSFRRGVGVSPS
jgi:hypothetical protein